MKKIDVDHTLSLFVVFVGIILAVWCSIFVANKKIAERKAKAEKERIENIISSQNAF